MVLFWHEPGSFKWGNVQMLPYAMDRQASIDLVWNWLEQQTKRDGRIEFDGSLGKGFSVWCEDWGHVGGNSYAFLAARPIYSWYGK